MTTGEITFWCSDYSTNHDRKIINTSCPAITTPGGNFLTPSLHYVNRGALWDTYRRHYGKPDRTLVAQKYLILHITDSKKQSEEQAAPSCCPSACECYALLYLPLMQVLNLADRFPEKQIEFFSMIEHVFYQLTCDWNY